ncbi:MAG: RHS repeat-associated core domain-containing protein [Verrucomicrobiales bacterium]|nr:RHS repeat-associated core domain-containing protein [Verrucomicrobiales bacterium]
MFDTTPVNDRRREAAESLRFGGCSSTAWSLGFLSLLFILSGLIPAVAAESSSAHSLTTRVLYDADGQRVGKQTVRWDEVQQRWRTNLTRFVIDPQHPSGYAQRLAEQGEGGEGDRAYLHGVHPITEVGRDGARYAVVDGHHSVRGQVEERGELAGLRNYDAFGGELPGGIATKWETDCEAAGYAGEFYDSASGLLDLRARHYEPHLGRFRTMDSYEGRPELPAGLHKYSYCENEPVNHTDPSGHESLGMQSVTSGGIGTVARMALPTVGRAFVHSRNLIGRSLVQATRLRRGDPMEYLTGRGVGALAGLATVATGLGLGLAFEDDDETEGRILYRGMSGQSMPDLLPDGETQVGSYLGIRPKDIENVRDGMVMPTDQGLSVTPNNPSLMHPFILGKIANGKARVWGIYEGLVDPRLTVRPDPKDLEGHAFIGVSAPMPVAEFKRRIYETQPLWSPLTP